MLSAQPLPWLLSLATHLLGMIGCSKAFGALAVKRVERIE